MAINRAKGDKAALQVLLKENASLLQQVRVLSEARHSADQKLSRQRCHVDDTQQALGRMSARAQDQETELKLLACMHSDRARNQLLLLQTQTYKDYEEMDDLKSQMSTRSSMEEQRASACLLALDALRAELRELHALRKKDDDEKQVAAEKLRRLQGDLDERQQTLDRLRNDRDDDVKDKLHDLKAKNAEVSSLRCQALNHTGQIIYFRKEVSCRVRKRSSREGSDRRGGEDAAWSSRRRAKRKPRPKRS